MILGDSVGIGTGAAVNVSSEVTLLRSGATVQLYVKDGLASCTVNVPKGTGDQTNIATIPSAYKPLGMAYFAFAPMFMNGEDMGRECNLFFNGTSSTIQFRTATTTTGTSGVNFAATWFYK